MLALASNKKEQMFSSSNLLGLAILLVSIAIFAGTNYYFAIGIPFAIALLALIIYNWKVYYWIYVIIMAPTAIISVGSTMMYLPLMPLSIISAMLALVLVLYHKDMMYKNFARHPLTLIIFLQFFWLIVAVSFSEIPFYSIKYLGVNIIQLLALFILPIFVFRQEKDWLTLCKIVLITYAIIAFIIFVRHAIDGFTYLYTNHAVKPFFYNHVDHGAVMSMFVPIAYFVWRAVPKEKRKMKLFYLGLLLFFVICTYLTFARAAILGVIFAFVVFFAIRKKIINLLMITFFITLSSLVFYLVKNDNYKSFRPNYEQTYSRHSFDDLLKASFMGGDMSSMERLFRWIASVRMSAERPITGVGPNNFYYYYKPHAVSMFRTYVSDNEEKSTTHNYFIFMLVEQGWPAMILYGIFIWALFYYAQKLYHQSKTLLHKRMALTAAMVIAAFFINNLFSELLQTYKIGALFYLAVVLIYWLDNNIKQENKAFSDQ